jgi:hypothetical protein
MAHEIHFSGGGLPDSWFHLCSIGAWGKFCRWVGSLPEDCSALHTLVSEGEVKGTMEVVVELRAVLEAMPPDDPGVDATARWLLDTIGEGDPEETATIES